MNQSKSSKSATPSGLSFVASAAQFLRFRQTAPSGNRVEPKESLSSNSVSIEQRQQNRLILLRQAAVQGDAAASFELAEAYLVANPNSPDTLDFLLQAVHAGLAAAQELLGDLYLQGRLVEKNAAQAAYWYHQAALQDDARAQNSLAILYQMGWGVGQDWKQALYWYRLSAQQGLPAAQYNLGLFYEKGRVVNADPQEAARWFRLAAEQGDAGGQASLALMHLQGRGVARNATEAAYWFEQSAVQGMDWAQYQLGCLYQQGLGVNANLSQAISWLQSAAEQGLMLAQYQLAQAMEQQPSLPDQRQIFGWYLAAARQGHAASQYQIGRRYLEGLGIEQNSSIGLYWCFQAAKQGDDEAGAYLSYFYQDGASASFYLDPSYMESLEAPAVVPVAKLQTKSWRSLCGDWFKRLRDIEDTEMASPA